MAAEAPGWTSCRDAPSSEDDPALADALMAPVRLVATALSELGLSPERHVHVIRGIRGIRSALHGFVDLERRDGLSLPEDIDTSFAVLTDMLLADLSPT